MLREKVFEDWKDNCHFIYLFANATVWDFYPKMGFKSVREYQYQRAIVSTREANRIQLAMNVTENRERLYDYAKNFS